jgi:hypothetical protein
MESESGYASANSLRVVQRLLWATISEHLNPAEREEVCEIAWRTCPGVLPGRAFGWSLKRLHGDA